jgi:energy-coupling factor transporter ATP-binding protein EcfA2
MLDTLLTGADLGRRGPPEPEPAALLPRQARTVHDTGLEPRFVTELVVKAIHGAGKVKLSVLAEQLKLSIGVLREVLAGLVTAQHAESAWCGDSDIDIQYHLTGQGQRAAAEYLAQSRYVGPAPVTLAAYRSVVERQSLRLPHGPRVTPGQLAAGLADDSLDPALCDLIGAALHSQRALLLYGPSGSGKTTLAAKLGRLLEGVVAVPYALLVGRAIVRLHDPALHPAPTPQQLRGHDERRSGDARWALCRRPLVHVGAELTRDMLDLRYDAAGGVYHAPPHLQANNGMLVVDDVGRQRIPATELANRWIGPLDHGVDQLSMQGGHSEILPFDATLVFATNLAPQAVFDEAVLRRIGYKIPVGALSEPAYRALLRSLCAQRELACDEAALEHLARLHRASGEPLLASYPQELLGRIVDFASFAGRVPRLSATALEQAWHSMFASCTTRAPASPDGAVILSGEPS